MAISNEQFDLPGMVVFQPFLKWVGVKRQLLTELKTRVPVSFNAYHEPFVGGGALFFALRPHRSFLSDSNDRLIRAYRGVRDAVEDVIERLMTMPVSEGRPEVFGQLPKRRN